jgi:fatty acid-binding protein DegV
MVVKVVTDSTSDLPPQLAKELGITVVPAYARLGMMSTERKANFAREQMLVETQEARKLRVKKQSR